MNQTGWTRVWRGMAVWMLLALMPLKADVKVTNIKVKPRYPWNGLVDITYSIQCGETDNGEGVDIYVGFKGYDTVLEKEFPMMSLTGTGASSSVKTGGPYTVTWNAAKDYPTINSSAFQIKIHAGVVSYMVVDLSGGPDASQYPVRYSTTPPNLDDDTCRTTELWLRSVYPGTFFIGSPTDELGHQGEKILTEVTLTKMFYAGVFECTQKQYLLVMGGSNSNFYTKGDCCPAEYVSYNTIRGSSSQSGGGWPTYGHTVDGNSFMGKLQAKTGLKFDLPTEAQWEYACRAGTMTALNSGKNLTSLESDSNMDEVGRYKYNRSDGKGGYSTYTKVGSYQPNAWGLYDMHGNVWEWCLDWCDSSYFDGVPKVDPCGPITGSLRMQRGGSWDDNACWCRSAIVRVDYPKNYNHYMGFRIFCNP